MTSEVTDGGKLYRARVHGVERPRTVEALRAVVAAARASGRKVSVRGARRSQGGHTFCDGAVVIDTAGLDKVLYVDRESQTARVQAGVTWDQLRATLNAFGLSTRSNQTYGVFTIGGSVSVSAHGRNVDYGILAASVVSLRVMLADGSVVEASRTENHELFRLVIGGFGLVGVLIDVTLALAPNRRYRKVGVAVMPTDEYPRYLAGRVLADEAIHFHYARLSVHADDLWQRLFTVDYRVDDDESGALPGDAVHPAGEVALQRFTIWSTRRFDWARRIRFPAELLTKLRPERTRRNNVAKEAIAAVERATPRRVDLLQEYFVPVARFAAFADEARRILAEERLLVLNTTVRFVRKNDDAFLSYAREDSLALVVFFEQKLDPVAIERTQDALRRLLDCALDHGGTYYLCYQRAATRAQFERAYPAAREFFALKKKYDPTETFGNQFYAEYAPDAPPPPRAVAVPPTATRYDRAAPPARARSLRLPPPETTHPVAGDGTTLRLVRYRGGDRGPVILSPGYAMTTQVFTLDTQPTSLAEYLVERGHDVWLFSWRSDPALASSATRFTLDDVAAYDWPAAVDAVLARTGAPSVHCVAHCLSAQTLLMSMLGGHLGTRVGSVAALQVAAHYDPPLLTRLKAASGIPTVLDALGVHSLSAAADARDPVGYRLLDLALRAYPIRASERCDNPTCRRAAFFWGELLKHANVDDATHARMAELLGTAPVRPFIQMARSTRAARVVDRRGRDVYLRHPERVAVPVTFVHGGDNATVGQGATRCTYELLRRTNARELYRRHVVPGYGHLDSLIGRDAGRDVFPLIAEHLDRALGNERRAGGRPASVVTPV